jgi:pyruvate dehydrogenase E1 component beta subunit
MPDVPEPTSYGLTKDFYYAAFDIAHMVHSMCCKTPARQIYDCLKVVGHHDVPGEWFTGPF